MTDPATAADGFATAAALLAAHKLLTHPDDDGELLAGERLDEVVRFVKTAVASGKCLDGRDDRRAAQASINYWVSAVGTAAREAGRKEHPFSAPGTDTLLEEFDPASLTAVAAAAEGVYGGLDPGDRVLARHLFLRLVRLRPDDEASSRAGGDADSGSVNTKVIQATGFEPIPAARGALHDRGDPARVDTVLKAFADAGVVRIVPGDSPAADQVLLRSAVLMRDWERLGRWMNERRDVRRRAAAWQEATARPTVYHRGREWVLWTLYRFANWTESLRLFIFRTLPAIDLLPDRGGDVLTAAELEDARGYHDRSELERAYIDASRFDAERAQARNRLLMGLFGLMALIATAGWVMTVASLYVARSEAVAATAAQVNEARARRAADDKAVEATLSEGRAKEAAAHLKVAKEAADERAKDLTARQELTKLRLLVRGLADLVVADDADAGKVAAKRLELLGRGGWPPPLSESLFDDLRKIGEQPRAERCKQTALSGAVIDRIRTARDRTAERDFVRESLKDVRTVAFEMSRFSADAIVRELGRPGADAAGVTNYVREFYAQYWGEMLLVEGPRVERAMYAFGRELSALDDPVATPKPADLAARLAPILTELAAGMKEEYALDIPKRLPSVKK